MGYNSKIEWCGSTLNPAYGCTKCGLACENCYAKRMAERFSLSSGVAHLFEGTTDFKGNWTGRINLFPERMAQVFHWRRPRRIFVGSMTDLFHPNVPFEFLDRVFAVMALAPWHTFILLTKRPERMREYLIQDDVAPTIRHNAEVAGRNLPDNHPGLSPKNWEVNGRGEVIPIWPLPNVWLGTTVWDQPSADKNVPELLGCEAAMRYVSVEPMLGPVDLRFWLEIDRHKGSGHWERSGCRPDLDWVICGAETGPGKRKMENKWAHDLRIQCEAAGVPFFFKKDSAGNHVLDGRTWEQFPEVGR